MKKTKIGQCHGRFLHAGAFSHERTDIIFCCILRTFASAVLFVQFPLCRTLVLVFHCKTVYEQPPPYPYIDSTTTAVWYLKRQSKAIQEMHSRAWSTCMIITDCETDRSIGGKYHLSLFCEICGGGWPPWPLWFICLWKRYTGGMKIYWQWKPCMRWQL